MAISNPNPSAKDVVILQRSDNNAFYGETHISGSDLIIYIDSTGHLNADTSASFYTKYPPASTALTSAFASGSNYSISSSWSSQSLSTSFFITHNNPLPVDQRLVRVDIADRDAIPLSDRYLGLRVWVVSDSQEYTLIGGLNNGFWFATPFTASFAQNSYFATTASFALNGGTGGGSSNLSGSNNFVPYWNANQLTTASLISVDGDNVGLNTLSPVATTMLSVTEMVTSSVIWTPTLLSVVPRFWFRADAISGATGSFVDRWPDSSIYKNDATASSAAARPFINYSGLNNKPFVTFDGTNDQLRVLSPASVTASVITAFVVARVTNYEPSLTPSSVGTIIGNSHAGNDRDFVIGERYDGGLNHFTWTTYTENVGANFSAETPVLPFEAKTNEWYINSVIVNGAASNNYLYLSGSASGSGVTTLSTNMDLRDLFIGYESASNLPFEGDIAEIIICTASYSTFEYQKVEGYLAWKYGLQASLISSHPFKLYPPTASVRGNIQDWFDYQGNYVAYLSSSGLMVVTASQAISASWAPPVQSPFATSASWASSSLSSSYSQTASFALNSNANSDSSSWASSSFSSSYARSASNADSASWAAFSKSGSYSQTASVAISASFATNANPNAISASWASSSFSSSYAISASWADRTKTSSFAETSSYSVFAQTLLGTVLSASYAFTASVATTASFALNSSPTAISASWATQSFSSSYARSSSTADTASYAYSASNAISASWAPPIISPFATSASWASASLSASYAQTSSVAISASWSPPQTQNTALSASWASQSFSASYALQSSSSLFAISASWAPTVGGFVGLDNYLPKWLNNGLTSASNYFDIDQGSGINVTNSLQIDATLTVVGGQTGSNILWTPVNAPLPMRVWLRADDITGSQSSSVGLWPDTGSYNNYFTQGTAGNQPKLWTSSLNGHSIVHFSGSLSQYLVAISGSTNIPQSSLCCFAVVRPWTYGASGNAFSTNDVIGNGHSGNSKDFAVGPRVFSGQRQWSMYNESGTSNFDIDAAASLSQSWYIMNGTVNGASSFLTLYIAGAATSSGVVNGSNDMDLRDLYVGYEINFGLPFDGDIAEIVLTTQVLTPDDQRKMEGYLAWKYGLQGNLPSDHPYSGSAPYSLDARTIQSWKNSAAQTVAYVSSSGLYVGTASWANNAISASWSPPQGVTAFAISSSWASSSLTASTIAALGGTGVPSYFPIWMSGSQLSNTSSMYQSGSTIGVGTTTPSSNYLMQVNGGFAATVKSFMIDHPTKEGKHLCYGSLESPYHGIRLTGREKVKSKKGVRVELPSYIYKLVRPESVNIQLTPIGRGKTFYIDEIDIENNCFYVKVDGKIRKKGYEFFWDFTAARADVPELITET